MATETNKNLPSKDEVLDNETALLQGLMEASDFKNDEAFRKTIEIRRGERVLFTFTVRPLDEAEDLACASHATPTKVGRNGLKTEGKTDVSKMRSWKIYTATIEEDKKRIWNNKDFHKQLGVINHIDMIDKVLRSGDKDAVIAVINQISGLMAENDAVGTEEEPSLEEYAKN